MSVSDVARLIRGLLDEHAPRRLRVVGEISNLSDRRHLYFSLKDDDAVLRCVAWESAARQFGFRPKDGMEVIATGHLQFYGPQGATQLYVSRMEPVGAGALELKLRALIDELRGLGYFDPARKKRFPILPRRVAVITSRNGAAIADVRNTMQQRCPAVDVIVFDVHVQGPKAVPDIVRSLQWIAAHGRQRGIDAVILTRGGGSLEDLWAFNERAVADVLLDSPLPVAAAIGHEVDTTVAELVADVRCATPTQAAMHVVPDSADLFNQIGAQQHRLKTVVERRLREAANAIERSSHALGDPAHIIRAFADRVLVAHGELQRAIVHRLRVGERQLTQRRQDLDRRRPEAVIARQRERLDNATARLEHAMHRRLQHRADLVERAEQALTRAAPRRLQRLREQTDNLHSRLRGLSPRHVLTRGYSITRRVDGPVVRNADEVSPGDRLETVLAEGTIQSRAVDPDHPDAEFPADADLDPGASSGESGTRKPRAKTGSARPRRTPVRAASKRRPARDTAGQLDLFLDHLGHPPARDPDSDVEGQKKSS